MTPSRSRATTPTSPSVAASSKKSSPRPPIWKCDQCGTTTTSQRRPGPKGRSTLCNACWTRLRKKNKAASQQVSQEKSHQPSATAGPSTFGNTSDGEGKVKAEKSSSSSSNATIASPDKQNKEHGTRAAMKASAVALASAIAASSSDDRIQIPLLPLMNGTSTASVSSESVAPSTPPPLHNTVADTPESIINGNLVATPPPRANHTHVATSPHLVLTTNVTDTGDGTAAAAIAESEKESSLTAKSEDTSLASATIALTSLPPSELETSMDFTL